MASSCQCLCCFSMAITWRLTWTTRFELFWPPSLYVYTRAHRAIVTHFSAKAIIHLLIRLHANLDAGHRRSLQVDRVQAPTGQAPEPGLLGVFRSHTPSLIGDGGFIGAFGILEVLYSDPLGSSTHYFGHMASQFTTVL